MSKLFTLIKVLFKTTGEGLIQKDKKKLPKTIALIVLLAVSFLPLVGSFVAMSVSSYNSLAKIGQEGVILSFGVTAACLVVFIFGIFYVMATFYFSSDIENLLPLPLKPSTILGAKFAVVLCYEYLTELVFLLPIIITYGIISHSGVGYYAYGAIVFLATPIVPLVVASLISMIIMRFTPFAKNKDAFKTIAGVLGLGISIGFNMFFQRFGTGSQSQEQIMQMMAQGNNSLIGTSSKLFPTAKLAVNAMVFNGEVKGLVNILLFIVITVALLMLLMLLGEALYFKGVVGISESASKRKKLSKEELEQNTVQSSSLKSYTIKELKLLVRTPAYFMNCVLMNFLFPVILLIPVFSQPELLNNLDKVRSALNGSNLPGFIIAIACGVMIFIAVANPTACTAISREGKNVFVCKYLPISYEKQIAAKVLSAIILNCIGLGMIIITFMVVLLPPVYLLVQIIVIAVLVTIFAAFGGILIDLSFPKLQWDNEQRAVKQNMNVLLQMLLGFVVGGITIFAILALHLSLWSSFGILAAVYGVLDILMFWIVRTYGVSSFRKLEA